MRKPLLAASLLLVACGTSASDSVPTPSFSLGDDAGAADVVLGGEDAAQLDTAPDLDETTCQPGATECEDDVLLTCAADGSALGRTRCSGRGQICVESPDGAACEDPEVPIVECEAPGAEEIGPGEYLIQLCDESDDTEQREQSDCSESGRRSRSGGDRYFTFTLTQPTEVFIDLRDEDDSAAIDTILYLRTDCEDPDSQVACSDDIPCEESDVPVECGDLQVRQSRIEGELEAGGYTIVVDHILYQGFNCGQVRLLLEY